VASVNAGKLLCVDPQDVGAGFQAQKPIRLAQVQFGGDSLSAKLLDARFAPQGYLHRLRRASHHANRPHHDDRLSHTSPFLSAKKPL
jgi:hypothetical protein